MSPSNIELLAQSFAGWGKDNPANMRDVLHPDCEIVVPDSIPYGGTFRGPDAVIGWFTQELWRWFDEFSSAPEGNEQFTDPQEATAAYAEWEAQHRGEDNLEIVLVGADSLETIKQTHGHYFDGAAPPVASQFLTGV